MDKIISLVVFLLIFHIAESAPSEDLVTFPVAGYHVHNWYSGYLKFPMGRFHYVFFESQTDPDNDPVVLWLNGGPGCSSLIGMMLEHGPFLIVKNGTGQYINENAWNKKANLLYLQSPGSVGFSEGYRNDVNNDTTVAEDNYAALVQFYKKFPNYKNNEFYISGESYAGIYIPYLAMKILEMNRLPNSQLVIPLKGILVGNACTDPRQCYEPTMYPPTNTTDGLSIYQYQYLHAHTYITDRDYQYIQGACTLGYASQGCKSIRKTLDAKFSQTLTVINNIYQPCYHQIIQQTPKRPFLQSRISRVKATQTCDDLKGILSFLNQPIMQQYLHVDPKTYDICSDVVADKYVSFQNASYWIYPLLIKAGLRIWVYSGDHDANVPITGTLHWINRLKDNYGIPVDEPWRQWWVKGLHKHEDQMAGMVWKLRGFTFVSVKGAGHMVPTDKPKQSKEMFDAFISGGDLPYKSQ